MTAYAGGNVEIEDLSQISGEIIAKLTDTGPRVNNTMTADPDLFTPELDANSSWILDGWLLWSCADVTPDIKFDITGPAGGDVRWSIYAQGTSVTSTVGSPDFGVQTGGLGADISRGTINGTLSGIVMGYVTIGATAGAIQLNWAQNTTNANGVTLLEGSWIRLRRIV
jgi:hypothetical protein